MTGCTQSQAHPPNLPLFTGADYRQSAGKVSNAQTAHLRSPGPTKQTPQKPGTRWDGDWQLGKITQNSHSDGGSPRRQDVAVMSLEPRRLSPMIERLRLDGPGSRMWFASRPTGRQRHGNYPAPPDRFWLRLPATCDSDRCLPPSKLPP